MAHGGPRPGAGRKKLAIEDNAQAAIKEAIRNDPSALTDIWSNIIAKAKKGSDRHAQLLFNYYYGKPKENEGTPTEMIITVNRVRR